MSTSAVVRRRANNILTKSEELSFAVPKVIHKRLSMIAQQNPLNNHTEWQEIERMITEKPIAFMEAWQSIATQTLIAHQKISTTLMDSFWQMLCFKSMNMDNFFYQFGDETLKVIEQGINPIHATATANAQRLYKLMA